MNKGSATYEERRTHRRIISGQTGILRTVPQSRRGPDEKEWVRKNREKWPTCEEEREWVLSHRLWDSRGC